MATEAVDKPAQAGEQTQDTISLDGDRPLLTPAEVPKLGTEHRYQIEKLIGRGGMGRVYKAIDRELHRPVALKFLIGGDAALERRFLQEARAQARVDHPGVCKVYEVSRIGDEPYIAMQFIDGKTFHELGPQLPMQGKLAVIRDVAIALEAAHKLGLVHRDVKPANILVEPGPRPFISDFGLARDLAAPGETVQGAVLGTPQYMAPEQAKGELGKLDARTDVYSLGATLYQSIAGYPPFDGGTTLQILHKMLSEDVVPPNAPPEVQSIVLKCLEKDPARRYQSAQALADDLQRAIDGEAVSARPPPSLVTRGFRRIRRNKWLALALAALVLSVLVPQVLPLFKRAPLVVAVADFDNQTGDPSLDGLSGLLITSLEQSRKLTVLTRSRMFDLARQTGRADAANITEAVGREVAQKANARALLLATLRKFDDVYVVDLKILEPTRNEYLAGVTEQAKGKASVPALIDKLSLSAQRALKEESQGPAAPVEDVTTRNLAAYQDFFRGEEAVDHLHFAAAADHFRKAVAIDPNFALAWYRLAYSLMWVHDFPRGQEAIERALALKAHLPPKELLLARGVRGSLFAKGEEAYEAYSECAKRWPAEKECVFMVGDVLFHGGYLQMSVQGFTAALALDPAMERAYQHLIWAYQILGENEPMLRTAQAYVDKVPGDQESFVHQARAQAAAGQVAVAKQTLARAATLLPGSGMIAVERAALQAWDYDVDGAAAALPESFLAQRTPHERCRAYFTLAGSLVQGGRIRESLAAYQKAADAAREDRDPEEEATVLAGQAMTMLLYQRDSASARRLARDAVARGLPETSFAFVYPLMGDLEDYSRVLHGLGDPLADLSVESFTFSKAGEGAKAAASFERMIKKSPFSEFLRYAAADAWMHAGDDAKAIEAFQRAQATFPPTSEAGPGYGGLLRARSELQLAAIYERSGQRQAALDATRRFLERWSKADSDLPELHDARARLARLQGNSPSR
ncbi:MAG TPA: serine/threonine-protein kinase [Myxococcales bacterium]|nr:serine/threonine-protein kinase [Myxococcales bacterium]